jgi:hypothetical protein
LQLNLPVEESKSFLFPVETTFLLDVRIPFFLGSLEQLKMQVMWMSKVITFHISRIVLPAVIFLAAAASFSERNKLQMASSVFIYWDLFGGFFICFFCKNCSTFTSPKPSSHFKFLLKEPLHSVSPKY